MSNPAFYTLHYFQTDYPLRIAIMETSDPMANSQAVTEPSPAASAWREWLGENGPKLLLFARQQTRSMEDAQDVFQDALVKLVEKICNGEFVGGQDSWLPDPRRAPPSRN